MGNITCQLANLKPALNEVQGIIDEHTIKSHNYVEAVAMKILSKPSMPLNQKLLLKEMADKGEANCYIFDKQFVDNYS